MNSPDIDIIDLKFRSKSGTIAVYLIPHTHGCILIEIGPGSTTNTLVEALNDLGYRIQDVTDIFLTHIHLDHAGAAGWWAKQGARVHVHERGAVHLINPAKLLASAERLYGNMMDTLWGEFLPVQEDHISIVRDLVETRIGNLTILALDVPGHASHHLAYLIGDACFSGDIGGIRLNTHKYISLPMPPPEFHLDNWRLSIQRIQQTKPKRIVPTHFGVYEDAAWHLNAVMNALDEVEEWMESKMIVNPSIEDLRGQFIEFEKMRAEKYGVEKTTAEAQQIANPSFMSADGIMRYWNKYRQPG